MKLTLETTPSGWCLKITSEGNKLKKALYTSKWVSVLKYTCKWQGDIDKQLKLN